jgi:hypothetical protein
MPAHLFRPLDTLPEPRVGGGEMRIGRIVAIEDGRPFVRFDASNVEPVMARVAVTELPCAIDSVCDVPVLLAFENGDASLPVIIGWVNEVLPQARSAGLFVSNPKETVEVDAKTLSFEGREAIVLRCGQASITLRSDGQVIVKGTRLTSRASETNKVRGATVQIN